MRAVFALVGLVAGCKGPPAPRDAPPGPGQDRGSFALTYYWVATEEGAGPLTTKIYGEKCDVLTTVSAAFAGDLATAGTGRLRDGRTLAVEGDCSCPRSPCYRFIGARWGIGTGDRELIPFRSVAVDRSVIPIGTKLWIKELAGLDTDQLFPHDGCVVADDVGGGITGAKLDWFVGDRALYTDIDHVLKLTSITVHDGGELCP